MNKHSDKGFTLIELIVSLAITSVIAVFVFGFATSLAKVWRSNESGVGTELDAQVALDQIAMDLESVIFAEKGVPMFAATGISYSNRKDSNRWVDPSSTTGGRDETLDFKPQETLNEGDDDEKTIDVHHYGWAGTWLRFFTASPSFNAVSYQLIRRPAFNNSSEPRYLLHRSLIRQDNTLAGNFDITATNYKDGNTANALQRPRLDGVILEDVVDFGVRLYVFDRTAHSSEDAPKGLWLIYPADAASNVDVNDTVHLGKTSIGNTFSERYPDVVEVFIRVLDDVGSRLLYELEEGLGGELDYDGIVKKHGRLYSRMIRIPGKEPKGYDPSET